MVSPRHIILCTQCYLHRGTCLNAMKRFYLIFLPVVLVFLYSIPGVFCLSGGEGIASSSFFEKQKKTKKNILGRNRTQAFNLLYWYCYIVYPEYFVCRGGGEASSSFFLKQKKHPRSESNPAFQSAREMLARFSRGFIYAAGIPIESRPWLAWAS